MSEVREVTYSEIRKVGIKPSISFSHIIGSSSFFKLSSLEEESDSEVEAELLLLSFTLYV